MATATEKKSEEKTPEKNVLPIPPSNVEVDWAGQCRKSVFVRLPDYLSLNDLGNEPKIWKSIQGIPEKALKVHDVVYAVAHDEAWAIEASVRGAGPSTVRLTKPRKIELDGHAETFWEDENYLIKWAGTGYGIWRKKDNIQMPGSFVNGNAAKHEILTTLYPKVA